MRKPVLVIISLFSFLYSNAQIEGEQPVNMETTIVQRTQSNTIYGKITDRGTGKHLEAATALLYLVDKQKKDSLLGGMPARANGEFIFNDLPSAKHFHLVISALGYETVQRSITIRNESSGFQKDMGNIGMSSNIKELKGVTIAVSAPALRMGIDRKIFNVEKSLLSTGGTALDVMKNIPSVSVDIDGNVELRNSTPQIFVDGLPTILTLDQIPSEQIARIELITNPSAKFDASSSGGIINVVLKKNKRNGLNGVATLSGGIPHLFSGNLNLNVRQGKFNFFVSAGHNESGGNAKGETSRQNKDQGLVTDYFNQNSVNKRERNFNSIRFGTDIFLSNRNTVTLSQNFVKGNFGNNEIQNQQYFNDAKTLTRYGLRTNDGTSGFNRSSSRVSYKHTFPKEGEELGLNMNYNYGDRKNNSTLVNSLFNADGSTYGTPSTVLNDGKSNQKEWTIQADYTDPINENTKLETGVRSYHMNFLSYYDVFARANGEDVKLPLSNNYAYTEMINAAYVTYSHKKKDFSYQIGLRFEQSKFDGRLVDSSYKFGYNFPGSLKNIWDALFPSFFVTQKITDKDEVQFNFTRRINRPRFWQLYPYVDITDPLNVRQGNPQLQPEYINSFEFNYSKDLPKGNLLSVLYFRSNPKDITEYGDTLSAAQYAQLNNAAIDPDAILNTFINASTTNRYGAEFTLQYKGIKNLELTPTLNFQYRTVKAKINNLDLSNKGFNWEAKLITNYKITTPSPSIFDNLTFQLIGDYESPKVIPQGKRLKELDMDFAVKKEFLKNKKAAITFAINDVFNSRRWGAIYDTEQYYQESYRRWRVRTFRVSFTFKFGDKDFSIGKGGNRNDGGDDD
ncbi:MAG: TonB-dependent receptor family protein [Bacteroidota bacterium]|nr:TonB-dependent receptor family protein [Bacteroidota bacterium]